MKKTLSLILCLASLCAAAADNTFTLYVRVKDAVSKQDLSSTYVYRLDADGKALDSIQANQGRSYSGGVIDTVSNFFFCVPRTDSICMLDANMYTPSRAT